ncbi:MAG: endo alpha-1,4 polygalactosaminidase [Deltaproteobacteria bacterium]|nr:endo alpha-1,4 polygalactosaminidase [Deltaproteobacteria bacterium]MBN2672882.1 endo alpha-1,4 polygalactosaminidase [Deltaproteobacteria bacterium]
MTLGVSCGNDESDDDDPPADWSAWEETCDEALVGDLAAGTTWHWQLTGDIDHSVDVHMYDVDLFNTAADEIALLQAEGRVVICYFSAGTWEDWRPDANQFDTAAIGKTMEEWDDEKWLDVRHESTRTMVEARLDMAVAKGCDGVEPDNMDGYVNSTGFDLSGIDQLNFNRFVALAAHARGLSVGLKNDVDQLDALAGCFDWALNEECFAYDECDLYAPFVSAGKAVFHVEYVDDIEDGPSLADDVCGAPSIEGFSTLVKDWDLTEWYWDCLP